MPIPTDFNPWEHLQDTLRRMHNRRVRQWFADLGGEEWDPNIETSRGSLRYACTMQDQDTSAMTILRFFLFYIVCRAATDLHPPLYSLPATEYINIWESYPQVVLVFKEAPGDAGGDRIPAEARYKVRWRTKVDSLSELEAVATKVKNDFAKPPFYFEKGRELYTYIEKEKGYYFQILAKTEEDAKKVIEQMWELQDTGTPEWEKYLKKHTDNKNYTVDEFETIFGDRVKLPRKRPIAKVTFAWAEFHHPLLVENRILVDRTGTKAKAMFYED